MQQFRDTAFARLSNDREYFAQKVIDDFRSTARASAAHTVHTDAITGQLYVKFLLTDDEYKGTVGISMAIAKGESRGVMEVNEMQKPLMDLMLTENRYNSHTRLCVIEYDKTSSSPVRNHHRKKRRFEENSQESPCLRLECFCKLKL